jgi:hypothetical protein
MLRLSLERGVTDAAACSMTSSSFVEKPVPTIPLLPLLRVDGFTLCHHPHSSFDVSFARSLAADGSLSVRVFESRKQRGLLRQLTNRLASGWVRWHSLTRMIQP